MRRGEIEAWIREHVAPTGPLEIVHERPWATVVRVPTADGAVWFKACAPVQGFEPRLTAALASRTPALLPTVVAHDDDRAWLLLEDAGTPLLAAGDALDAWFAPLPLYAELQRRELEHADEHLAAAVPDQRLAELPAAFEAVLAREVPIDAREAARLRALAPRFAELCAELAADGVGSSIQHDDLHAANVYVLEGRLRVLDWGDSCVSHPFTSLSETFRMLESDLRLAPEDPAFARLRDAYLEPWGRLEERREACEIALVVGSVGRVVAGYRQRDAMPADELPEFDVWLAGLLRRSLGLLG